MVLVYSQQFSRLTQPLGDGATDEAGKPSRIKQFLKTAIMLFVEQRINFVNEDVQVFDSSEKIARCQSVRKGRRKLRFVDGACGIDRDLVNEPWQHNARIGDEPV